MQERECPRDVQLARQEFKHSRPFQCLLLHQQRWAGYIYTYKTSTTALTHTRTHAHTQVYCTTFRREGSTLNEANLRENLFSSAFTQPGQHWLSLQTKWCSLSTPSTAWERPQFLWTFVENPILTRSWAIACVSFRLNWVGDKNWRAWIGPMRKCWDRVLGKKLWGTYYTCNVWLIICVVYGMYMALWLLQAVGLWQRRELHSGYQHWLWDCHMFQLQLQHQSAPIDLA